MTASGADPFVRTVQLTKWYGQVTALQDVSLHLEPGIWALLGPNGAGKSTFLGLLAGTLRPSLGSVSIAGNAPFGNRRALARIGLCPEADALYEDLTALETVAALAELSGIPRSDAAKRADAALDAFGLADAKNRRVGGFSRGMRQRVKLAQSVVHEPDVLLLDEPLTGTDPASRSVILDQIRARAEAGAVVVVSTHVLHEAEALTDRILLLARGQLVAQGTVQSIHALLEDRPHTIRVRCDRPRDLAAKLVLLDSTATLRFADDRTLDVETRNPDASYDAVARAILDGGHHLESVHSPDATLEALFHHLVERGSRGAGTGSDATVGRAGQARLARGEASPR